MGTSRKRPAYFCTVCGKRTQRSQLTVKRAIYAEMGRGGKVIRSRTTGWLCSTCRTADPDWRQDVYSDAPGWQAPAPPRPPAE